MAVPESIVKAYADYLGGMDDSKKARRAMGTVSYTHLTLPTNSKV